MRAACYEEAGADALVIHSKARAPSEVLNFARLWNRNGGRAPLIAIPTTYHSVTARALANGGFSMVIYANHPLRAAIQATDRVLRKIREADGSTEIESELTSVSDVLSLVGTQELL